MVTATEWYTMPAEHFCPTCGVHNRAQDNYSSPDPTLLEACPVCKDKRRRGEPIADPPAWDAGREAWSAWVTAALPDLLRPLARKVGLA